MAKDLELFNKKELKKIEKANASPIESRFSKEELKTLQSLKKHVREEFLRTTLSVSEVKSNGKGLVRISSISKVEYIEKLANAFCTPEAFFKYYDSFSEEGKQIFRKFAFENLVSKKDIYDVIYGKREKNYLYFSDKSELPFSFLIDYSEHLFSYLPTYTRKCLQIYLKEFKKPRVEISDEKFKEQANFFSEKEGLEFFVNLSMIVQVLNDAKFFERDVGATILKTTLKKLDKIIVLSQFPKEEKFATVSAPVDKSRSLQIVYDEKDVERYKLARTNLALAFLSLTVNELLSTKEGKKEFLLISSDPKALLKRLMKAFETSMDFVFDRKFLYPHLYFSWFNERAYISYREKSMGKLFSIIRENLPTKPIEFSEYLNILVDKGAPNFFDDSIIALFVFYDNCVYSDPNRYQSYRCNIYGNERVNREFVFDKVCTNLFLIFASLGLFELSWRAPCGAIKNAFDVVNRFNDVGNYIFGKIGTIKVTPLGSYIFGATEELNVPGIKSFTPPKLDSKALTIHIDEGDRAMQVYLSQFCIQLSHSLYKADEFILKKSCSSKKDVESIFETLTARSKEPLPTIWMQLKKRILESFVTLSAESDWCIFPLENIKSPIIKEIEKLSKDGLCLKVEGKRVAVRFDKLQSFKKKLENAGFKMLLTGLEKE